MGYLLNLLKTFIFEMYCKNRALHENEGVYLFRVCASKASVRMLNADVSTFYRTRPETNERVGQQSFLL